MKIGYTRSCLHSPPEADADLQCQIKALQAFGCQEILEYGPEEKNAGLTQRQRLISGLGAGDQRVVYKLDCLGFSLRDTIQLINA